MGKKNYGPNTLLGENVLCEFFGKPLNIVIKMTQPPEFPKMKELDRSGE